MKDICYQCGIVQEYGTMKDIDEVSFKILCDSCYNKGVSRADISGELEVNPFSSTIKKFTKQELLSELKWWREYGYYVANAHSNVDGEACGYADGDEEYEENFK